jgi:hypothetical protein
MEDKLETIVTRVVEEVFPPPRTPLQRLWAAQIGVSDIFRVSHETDRQLCARKTACGSELELERIVRSVCKDPFFIPNWSEREKLLRSCINQLGDTSKKVIIQLHDTQMPPSLSKLSNDLRIGTQLLKQVEAQAILKLKRWYYTREVETRIEHCVVTTKEMGLRPRTYCILIEGGYIDSYELVEASEHDLCGLRGFGLACLAEVNRVLEPLGIRKRWRQPGYSKVD